MDAASPTHRLLVRASVGLIQGIALYLLTHAVQTNRWPSTDRAIFAPLVQIAIFTPLVFQFGVGVLRTRTLLIWAGVVTLVLIGLGLHDAARAATNPGDLRIGVFGLIPGPSLIMTGFVALGLFIAQSLVTAGDAEPKFLAPYPGYFDAGWKIELQIAAAILFVGAFWVLLFLGSALLALIDVRFLRRLIEHQWFSIPVTTLALATAIHLTDVRTSIIAGLRSLIHIVLSWLLPMIAIIVGIFLVSLPFTGLEPLWRTSHAASLLLGVSAALIILINAVYGDGAGEEPAPRILRIAGSAAAIELVPLAIIATSAIGLRVTQYGWTVDRVYAAGATVVAACYAVGYAYSAFGRGAWLRRLEPCNVLTSFVILATLLALLTPLADPARISVASQVSRLKSGAVAPDKFDYAYLRWSGQRYGGDALRTLASGDDVAIKDGADQALRMANRFTPGIAVPTDAELAAAITRVSGRTRAGPTTSCGKNGRPPPSSCGRNALTTKP